MLFSPSRIRVAAAGCHDVVVTRNFCRMTIQNAVLNQPLNKRKPYRPFFSERAGYVCWYTNHCISGFHFVKFRTGLPKGDAASALFTYILTLHRTAKSPWPNALWRWQFVNAFGQAEAIYQKWRENSTGAW